MIGSFLELRKNNTIKGPGIICVKASLKYQWLKEIEKFSNLRATIIKTPSAAGKKFDEQFTDDIDLYILNYETLRNDQVYDKLREVNVDSIFCDEIHYCNNHKSKRSKALYKFNDLPVKIGATATPITNNPLNMFGIFNMINPELFINYSRFSKRYVIWKYRRPVKAKNVDELLDKVRPFIFKKSEEDIIGQLPDLVLVPPLMCPMTSNMIEVNNIINDKIDDIQRTISKLDKKNVSDTAPEWQQAETQLMTYQTFAQELADDISLIHDSDSNVTEQFNIYDFTNHKLDTLIDLIDDITTAGSKVCIFTKYERMQNIIIAEINKRFDFKVAYVNGSMNAEERYNQSYTLFTDKEDYKVIVATDAMSEGISLSRCNYLIEYDLAPSYAIQTQRHGRIRRANSISRTSYVYQLITEDSWDEIQQKIINKKKNYDKDLIQDL